MTRARDLARFANNQAISVDTDFDVGINSSSPAATLDVRGNTVITGILTATSFSGSATGLSGSPSITVTDITASGNVSVGGTLTYEDVTNVDSVGVVTARSGIQIPNDSGKLRSGTDLEMQVFHDGTNSVVKDTRNSGKVRIQADNFDVIDKDASITMLSATSTGVSLLGDIDVADKIVHTGDTNTAIRFPAADTFTVETSGSERLRVNSDGFLGIKTSSVLAPLHVYDASNNTMARLESGDATCRLQLKDNTGEGYVLATGDDLIFANTSSVTERLRIDSTGRIGVGTDSFNDAAEVMRVQAPSGQNNTLFTIKSNSTSGQSILNFGDDDFNEGRIIYDHSDNSMQFRTDDSERARITSGGNVGVGTDDPYYKLHLHTTNNTTSLSGGSGGNWGSDGIRIENFNNTAGSMSLAHFRNFDADWHIGGKYVGTNDSDFLFFAEGDEKLRITSTGRIGIGTDDPQGLLVIQGDSNGSSTPSIRLQDGTDNRQCAITNSSGDLILFNSGSDNTPHCKITMFDGNIFSFETANTERLRIDSNGNFIFKNGALIENGFHDDGGGITGDYNHDLGTYGNVHYAATNAAGSFTYNLRINSSTSVNSVMAEGDTLSFTLISKNNNTSNYMTAFKIDGTTITPEWAGGSGPSAATGSGFDVYSFTCIKTGNAAFKVFASFTNHD